MCSVCIVAFLQVVKKIYGLKPTGGRILAEFGDTYFDVVTWSHLMEQ